MALGALDVLPHAADLHRVLELQAVDVLLQVGQVGRRPLGDDGVARLALGGDGLARVGLETGPVFSYRVETEFAGMPYDSGFLQFSEGETEIPWNIMVFDTTPDRDMLSLAMAHVIMAVGEGYLSVTEYHVVVNDSDLTYIGAEVDGGAREVLSFSLPAGAGALDFSEGLTDVRLRPDGSGFSD